MTRALPSTERGRRRREAIIDAAATLMVARGIAATALSDVLAASGTGKSQLYHYFRDKQDLVAAVIERQLERVLAAQPALDGDDVEAWARGILTRQEESGGPFSCPLGVLSSQVDDDPALRARQAAAFRTWQDRIAGMLGAAQRAGRLDPAAGPDEFAGRVLAALQGGLMLARLHRDPRPLRVALGPLLAPAPSEPRARTGRASHVVSVAGAGTGSPTAAVVADPRSPRRGARVADNIYSKTEIVGTSDKSIDEAIRGAVRRASSTLREVSWFEVAEIRGHVQDGEVGHYQVTLKVGFGLEDSKP